MMHGGSSGISSGNFGADAIGRVGEQQLPVNSIKVPTIGNGIGQENFFPHTPCAC
jgi:hypothetical protein